jgi:hypothetical protein
VSMNGYSSAGLSHFSPWVLLPAARAPGVLRNPRRKLQGVMERRQARSTKPSGFAPCGASPDARLSRKRARLSALHRDSCPCACAGTGSGPRLRTCATLRKPSQRAPRARPVVAVGRSPGAARVRGYEPRPQAPHPIPSSLRLRKTPLGGLGDRNIRLFTRMSSKRLLNVGWAEARSAEPTHHSPNSPSISRTSPPQSDGKSPRFTNR